MKRRASGKVKTASKMYLTLILLVLMAVVITVAGFAWYTLSTNPEITGTTFSVNGDQAIQISTDNRTYSYSVQLPDFCTSALTPVSTVDGLNWFICKYDYKGNVLTEDEKANIKSQFKYFRFPDGGNEVPESHSGEDENYCYYAYKDIYLKTTEESVSVYLSVPNKNIAGYTQNTEEQNHYGTYVLCYTINEKTEESSDESGPAESSSSSGSAESSSSSGSGESSSSSDSAESSSSSGSAESSSSSGSGESSSAAAYSDEKKVTLMQGGSETAARIGLMMLGTAEEGTEAAEKDDPEDSYVSANSTSEKHSDLDFYIYEPNATARTEIDKSNTAFNTDTYVSGFMLHGSAEVNYKYLEGKYIQTYPVAPDSQTAEKIWSALSAGNGLKNKNITGDSSVGAAGWAHDSDITGNKLTDGVVTTFNKSRLIAQTKSTWKTDLADSEKDKLMEYLSDGRVDGKFDSTMLSKAGRFFSIAGYYEEPGTAPEGDNSDYSLDGNVISEDSTSAASDVKLLTLQKDQPQKIRVYFWIEGQDIDCWNDLADTYFLVNLEFTGKSSK